VKFRKVRGEGLKQGGEAGGFDNVRGEGTSADAAVLRPERGAKGGRRDIRSQEEQSAIDEKQEGE